MMRNLLLSKKIGVFLIVLLSLLVGNVNGATFYSVVSGNWNSAATWSATPGGAPGTSVPGAAAYVIINTSNKVTVDVNEAARSITINGTLEVDKNDAISLIVEGDITVNLDGKFECLSGGTPTIIIKGNFTNNGTTDFNQANVIVVGNFISPETSILQNLGNLII